MRAFVLGVVLTVAVLFPNMGNAQVFQFRTPPPDVTAAGAAWQINSEPIVVGGLIYYPTRGFRMFDGQVMAQTGIFEGVPVYADTTIEPYSELYVPLGSEPHARLRAAARARARRHHRQPRADVPGRQPIRSRAARTDRHRRQRRRRRRHRRDRSCRVRHPTTRSLASRPRPRHTVITPVASGVDQRRLARVQRRALVQRRRRGVVLAGSLRADRRVSRVPGVSRQDQRQRRHLGRRS